MAAGGGGSSGKASAAASSSAGGLEASLDRKLQAVTNTMESIQGLSSWCLENKRHHSTIVYHWMKWLRRCEWLQGGAMLSCPIPSRMNPAAPAPPVSRAALPSACKTLVQPPAALRMPRALSPGPFCPQSSGVSPRPAAPRHPVTPVNSLCIPQALLHPPVLRISLHATPKLFSIPQCCELIFCAAPQLPSIPSAL